MIISSTPDSAGSALPPVIGVVASQLFNPYQQKVLDEVTRQLNARGMVTVLLSGQTQEELTALIRRSAPLVLRGLLVLPGSRVTDAGHLPVLEFDAEPELQADALQAAGRVLNAGLTAEGDDRESAWQAMMHYLKKTRASERIQALFCESDLLAFGAMQAIRDFGQGAHLAVAGFGDSEEARSATWHLTSWSPDIRQIMGNALDRWLGQHVVTSQVQGQLARRHSHFGKIAPGEMSACGCAFRH